MNATTYPLTGPFRDLLGWMSANPVIAPAIMPPRCPPIETPVRKNPNAKLMSRSGPNPVSQKRTPRRSHRDRGRGADAEDGARRATARDERIEHDRAERPGQERGEVDRGEPPRADRGFEHLPDEPEGDHVEEDVRKPEVDEARGDEPPPFALVDRGCEHDVARQPLIAPQTRR